MVEYNSKFVTNSELITNAKLITSSILPTGILSNTFYSASKLFFLAVQGSGTLMSSNLEEALYKSP